METNNGTISKQPFSDVVLEVKGLKTYFHLNPGFVGSLMGKKDLIVKAVDNVSFHVKKGEILGLAGESGCGKTTTALTSIGVYTPTSGKIYFDGKDVSDFSKEQMFAFRSKAQMVFQDPYQSLNPRFTILDSVIEPLVIHGIKDPVEQRRLAIQALESVRLHNPVNYLGCYPHQLSGGERQRICIARALTLQPRLLVADEPVSMLDVSVRAGIIDLIRNLAVEMNLAAICISHDLSNQRYLTDRLGIMYLGKIVEVGSTETIISKAFHPYTKALLSAVAVPNPKFHRNRIVLEGEVPDAVNLPKGCRFSGRCPESMQKCFETEPDLLPLGGEQYTACFRCE